MKFRKRLAFLGLLIGMVLASCSADSVLPQREAEEGAMERAVAATSPAIDGEMTIIDENTAPGAFPEDPADYKPLLTPKGMATEAMVEKETLEAMPEGMQEMAATPAWFGVPLIEVASGKDFTVGDLKGKVVLVETMAIWCSNCLKQQQQVKALHDLLGENDDFTSLGLDIDLFEQTQDLKAYIERQGFDWVYAVAPPDVSQEIGQLYGNQFLNPPSTPMLIIDRSGEVHPLPFGIKSAEELLTLLQPFLDDSL